MNVTRINHEDLLNKLSAKTLVEIRYDALEEAVNRTIEATGMELKGDKRDLPHKLSNVMQLFIMAKDNALVEATQARVHAEHSRDAAVESSRKVWAQADELKQAVNRAEWGMAAGQEETKKAWAAAQTANEEKCELVRRLQSQREAINASRRVSHDARATTQDVSERFADQTVQYQRLKTRLQQQSETITTYRDNNRNLTRELDDLNKKVKERNRFTVRWLRKAFETFESTRFHKTHVEGARAYHVVENEAEHRSYTLIVRDMTMPDTFGRETVYELLKVVRENERRMGWKCPEPLEQPETISGDPVMVDGMPVPQWHGSSNLYCPINKEQFDSPHPRRCCCRPPWHNPKNTNCAKNDPRTIRVAEKCTCSPTGRVAEEGGTPR